MQITLLENKKNAIQAKNTYLIIEIILSLIRELLMAKKDIIRQYDIIHVVILKVDVAVITMYGTRKLNRKIFLQKIGF
jgi:hypothetical protein